MATAINTRWILAYMAIDRLSLLFRGYGKIDIIGRMKNKGLLPGTNLKEIKGKLLWLAQPCLYGQQARYLVVFMGVEWPMRKYYIRFLVHNQSPHFIHPLIVTNRVTVNLSCKYRFGI